MTNIQLNPGDYTDMPADAETRERIVRAFVEAGASRTSMDDEWHKHRITGAQYLAWDIDGDIFPHVRHQCFGTYYTNAAILATDQPDYRNGQWWPWTGGVDRGR